MPFRKFGLVEVAIKMAIQYWYAQGQTGRSKLLTIRSGYHGDTFAAMSVCDPVGGMHELFSGVLPKHLFVRAPQCLDDTEWSESELSETKQILAQQAHEVAAVILEPIIQGAGGMRFYCPQYLRRIRELCDAHDVLLIADEIATGFGRTGKLFACEHAGITPDILCVGKALTGGTMTLAATLASEEVCRTLSQGEPGVFMHGPTFMGNALACAAAHASLDLLDAGEWSMQIGAIERSLAHALGPCRGRPAVADVRVLGGIGVVELHEPVDMERIADCVTFAVL